jgi:hypothetical protein
MSHAPDDLDALLIRVRTMKWQAVTVLGSSAHGLTRAEAAALAATMDGIASGLGDNPAPDAIKAAKESLDALARLRDHPPLLRRAAGQA